MSRIISIDDLLPNLKHAIRAEAEAAGQFTLGKLIAELEKLPQDAKCKLCNPHSYRGYYDQLAFEGVGSGTVADALASAKFAMGQVFEGYKGGDFWMTGNTMVWLANYGSCGDRIVGLGINGDHVVVSTAKDD
jgi:hypothetical protein